MSERVLIANRGEIAVRIIRACRDVGLGAVAVYGAGDEDALHVELADSAYRIDSEAPIPYLDGKALVTLANRAGARFVHPGYGFLAENAAFAGMCADAGLTFVGPPASAIATMGDKVAARAAAVSAGVPVLPGTSEPVPDEEAANSWAETTGFPVVLKAAAGGGGRGFRVARSAAEVPGAFAGAQSEALRSFGDGRLYVERYLDRPRHVEVQVFADQHGNVVAIGDRDCSIQRRHQKLVEECPAPNISEATRTAMADAAVRLAQRVGYGGAGTLEFLVEPDGTFWFLEMNTRIQVEHTVTEEVYGVDLVREQLLVAMGERLSLDPRLRGHAIQCRINAEDPGRGFAPTPGRIARFVAPSGPGVRIDTAVASGMVISDRYDSLIAKLVATGGTRDQAIARMRRALAELIVEGVPSTVDLHRNIISSAHFQAGDLSTSFLVDHPEVVPPGATPGDREDEPGTAWTKRVLEVNGRRFQVRLPAGSLNGASGGAGRSRLRVRRRHAHGPSGPRFASPIQGAVLRVFKAVGDEIAAGDPIMVVEAMKMENELRAQRAGRLTELAVDVGSNVKVGDHLFTIEDGLG
jgi:acetyl-CoA/propionyl-CoA carboxylase, biotin carboxylase, biotin carboxyl carrier protein